MSERIAKQDHSMPRHDTAMKWVNSLIIDLKKQMLGYPVREPITMERLNEWHQKHFHDLNQCRSGGLKQ